VVYSVLRDFHPDGDRITKVCFSPDGLYLATGAVNGRIYASFFSFDLSLSLNKHTPGSSGKLGQNTYEMLSKGILMILTSSIPSTSRQMADTSSLPQTITLSAYGTCAMGRQSV
jgi:WD40 repeat protein